MCVALFRKTESSCHFVCSGGAVPWQRYSRRSQELVPPLLHGTGRGGSGGCTWERGRILPNSHERGCTNVGQLRKEAVPNAEEGRSVCESSNVFVRSASKAFPASSDNRVIALHESSANRHAAGPVARLGNHECLSLHF